MYIRPAGESKISSDEVEAGFELLEEIRALLEVQRHSKIAFPNETTSAGYPEKEGEKRYLPWPLLELDLTVLSPSDKGGSPGEYGGVVVCGTGVPAFIRCSSRSKHDLGNVEVLVHISRIFRILSCSIRQHFPNPGTARTRPSVHTPPCPLSTIPRTQLSTTPSILLMNPSFPAVFLFSRAIASKTYSEEMRC